MKKSGKKREKVEKIKEKCSQHKARELGKGNA